MGCVTSPKFGAEGSGKVESSEEMGVRYLLGKGVVQNDNQAFVYFKKAAEYEGNPFAQNELAYLYFAGKGAQRNLEQAFFWYKKSCGIWSCECAI